MEHNHHEQTGAGGGQAANDTLDRDLDGALAKYTAVEPRAGLNERILANLRAQQERILGISWWRWTTVLAAVVVVAAALAWRWSRPSPPAVTNHPSISTPAQAPTTQLASGGESTIVRPAKPAAIRTGDSHRVRPVVEVAAQPKLDQFPSPEPLSEQEQILQHYVAQYPDHAVLIARARTEELRRDAEEMGKDSGNDLDGGQ
jgi:hypothetical protein